MDQSFEALVRRVAELRREKDPHTGKIPGQFLLERKLVAEGWAKIGPNRVRKALETLALQRTIDALGARATSAEERAREVAVTPGPLPAPTQSIEPSPPEPTAGMIVPYKAPPPQRPVYDNVVDALYATIGKGASRFAQKAATPSERYAVYSDVHMPWEAEEALHNGVALAESIGCTQAYIAGDGFEFMKLSRWPKEEHISFVEEVARAHAKAEWFCSRFHRVRIFGGNHDGKHGRFGRFLNERLAEEFHFLVKDPLELILAGIPNVEIVGHEAPFGEHLGWLHQVGKDAILTHCELGSAQQGANLERLKNWVREWGPRLGLTSIPRLITTGHTHRSTVHHEDDRMLVETGCMASWQIQGYQYKDATLKNRKPGVHAFLVLVQEDGVTNLSETRLIRV